MHVSLLQGSLALKDGGVFEKKEVPSLYAEEEVFEQKKSSHSFKNCKNDGISDSSDSHVMTHSR